MSCQSSLWQDMLFYISKIYSTFTCDFKNKNDTYYDKSKTASVAV